ncbi:MAG: hypothetical protein KF819_18715 [Labilithrix sp.]|nr:hypothetical protein [Labilithrix sp.]
MRSSLVVASLLLAGCAHTASSTTIESAPPMTDREIVAIDAPPLASQLEAPKARPRLSQTVTLGQGQSEGLYTPPPPPVVREGGPNVTVNNNVTVNQAPAFGFGGYGYGFGPGGGYGEPFGSHGQTHQAWAPSGWEGARRTAPPGATPGVGGNWAPAPSFGPAPMR